VSDEDFYLLKAYLNGTEIRREVRSFSSTIGPG